MAINIGDRQRDVEQEYIEIVSPGASWLVKAKDTDMDCASAGSKVHMHRSLAVYAVGPDSVPDSAVSKPVPEQYAAACFQCAAIRKNPIS